jgi:carboxymethylenebutenolidase
LAAKTVWRIGGVAAAFALGGVLALNASFLSARPLERPGPGVHAQSIKYASGNDSITAFIAFPEHPESAHAVLVIDEAFGASDFVRDVTERIAQKGLVALAPDLLSRHGGSPASADDARKALAALDPDSVMGDLDAAASYVEGLDVVNGTKIGVIGFGWGGGETFRYAAHNPAVRVFVVCYGAAPKVFPLAHIKGTGLGVYADRDGRVTQALYTLVRDLHKAGVDYRFKIYPNTAHGFLKTRQPPAASVEAWEDITTFLNVWLNQ